MKNLKDEKAFAMIGFSLLGLTTELVAFGYYLSTLNGWWRLLLLGLGFVMFVQLFSSHWCVSEKKEWPIVRAAFCVSVVLALIMAFNAGMILITRTDEKKARNTRAEVAKAEADKTDQEHRSKIAQQQSEIELMKGLDPRVAKELIKSREQTQQLEAEARKRKELQEAAAPKPAETPASTEDFKDVVDFARWYCRSLVFMIPTVAGIVGMASLLYVVMMSRKAAALQMAAGRAPVSGPMPVSSSNPPTPMPIKSSNPEFERIRMSGRDGGSGKN